MADETSTAVVVGRKISVTFERKMTDDNYGSSVARAWVEGTIADDANESQTAEALAALFMPAVAAVFEQLAIEYSVDDNQIIRETCTPKVTVSSAPRQNSGENSGGSGSGGLRVLNQGWHEGLNGPLPEWLLSAAAKAGVTGVFDNRAEVGGTKKPHFKEAVVRGGTGHGKDGEAAAFWPPK